MVFSAAKDPCSCRSGLPFTISPQRCETAQHTQKKNLFTGWIFFFLSLLPSSSPSDYKRGSLLDADTITYGACVQRCGWINPATHSRRKKKKRKSRVSKSPPFIHWLVILLHYILFLPASMILLLLLFPFSFFSISGLRCFRSRNLFFAGAPPTEGKPLGGTSLFRLTGCQVDPSASIRWLGRTQYYRRENDSCI